jgi:predicted ATPase/DNA-binding winged helix-turn-helix (wHTH) protein
MKEFAQFRLDTVNQCLWRHMDTGADERILLTPKAFAVLRHLVEHAGRLMTLNELLDAAWPDTHVEPAVLNNQILNIRNVLGDHAKSPVFIETVPRRGYRFIAPVRDGVAEANLGGASLTRKLVGRQGALGELQDSLRKALRAQRQIVFITGESGIGKTALADEFQRRAAEEVPGIRIVRGQCVEGYSGKEAYFPMLEALGQLCRGSGGEPVVRILASQAPTWLVQFPALIRREHREMLQREVLGATRERMLREIGDALEAIASETPLLLVFADLHWVDPFTVDLISSLARRRGPARLMMLATYRPADLGSACHPLKALTRDLVVHGLCHEIALEPLTKAEIAEFLTLEARGARPPEALASLLYRHSEGNPLFMVAALEHLVQRGLISRERGVWELEVALEVIDLEVPEGVRRMIEVQIERLGTEEQRALEAACVNGVAFSVHVTAAPAGLDEERFEDLCEDLSRRQHLVRWAGSREFPDGTVSQRYEFAHALYREVFYRRLPPGRRAKLHLRVGERLEGLFAQHESEIAAELAEHFEKASERHRAVKYLRLAAETSGRRFEPRRAVEILGHALQLAGKLPEAERAASEIEILEKLAGIYTMLNGSIRAIQTYEDLAARTALAGLIDVEVRALIDMA